MGLEGQNIMIYLNGSSRPVIDMPVVNLFKGNLSIFRKPLVGKGLGGFYSYIPIPYQQSFKIVVGGTTPKFFQIQYNELANTDGIPFFSMNVDPKKEKELKKNIEFYSSCGNIEMLQTTKTKELKVDLSLKKNEIFTLQLPSGKNMIRAVILEGNKQELIKALQGQVAFFWDEAKSPAVDIPLQFFYGQIWDPKPYQSLLVGCSNNGYYNLLRHQI